MDDAMHLKLRIRNKLLKAAHHRVFLQKCLDAGRVSKGLKIYHHVVHLMDSPSATETQARLKESYARTQRDIIEALIEHYVNVDKECQTALTKVEKTIRAELEQQGPEASAKYEIFLKKMEWSEDTQRSILSKKERGSYCNSLLAHTRTNLPQHTHTLSPQTTIPARKALGQYPVRRGRGKGPANTPYKIPDRTPCQSGIKPALLPPPAAPEMELNSIRSTLRNLVSQLEGKINRRACVHSLEPVHAFGDVGNSPPPPDCETVPWELDVRNGMEPLDVKDCMDVRNCMYVCMYVSDVRNSVDVPNVSNRLNVKVVPERTVGYVQPCMFSPHTPTKPMPSMPLNKRNYDPAHASQEGLLNL